MQVIQSHEMSVDLYQPYQVPVPLRGYLAERVRMPFEPYNN